MKMRFPLVVLFLMMWSYVGAAHWMTYYVYHEAYYVQGPWSRTDLLRESGFRYLAAQQHEDLFGTERVQLVRKMLSRLQDQKPELYDWDYELEIRNDTAIIVPVVNVEPVETIKNEIIATLGVNGFKVVKFGKPGEEGIWTLQDLTLPFLDLVSPSETAESGSQTREIHPRDSTDRHQDQIKEDKSPEENDQSNIWIFLFTSALLNVILLVFLTRKYSSDLHRNS